MIARRQFLKNGLALSTLLSIDSFRTFASTPKKKFKIGACDWSIGKSSDPAAFEVAKQIGLEGLMVNMGSKKDGLHLRQKSVQEKYLAESQRTGVAIASLAIGELNNHPYKSDPETEQWVYDSVNVARNLGVKVVLLAFFHNNDLRNDEAGIQETIRRLKKVAPHAEHHGIILGVESYLDGAQHLRILDAVGSKNVKVYMDFRNTADAGYDVLKEVKIIGSENICELHIKENGALLGEGSLPWMDIRDVLSEINYSGDGWMQIEGATPQGADVIKSYQHNLHFLQNLFSQNI